MLAHRNQAVIHQAGISRVHEVQIARVAGGNNRLSHEHSLGETPPEALGAMQGDKAVAVVDERLDLPVVHHAIDEDDAWIVQQR